MELNKVFCANGQVFQKFLNRETGTLNVRCYVEGKGENKRTVYLLNENLTRWQALRAFIQDLFNSVWRSERGTTVEKMQQDLSGKEVELQKGEESSFSAIFSTGTDSPLVQRSEPKAQTSQTQELTRKALFQVWLEQAKELLKESRANRLDPGKEGLTRFLLHQNLESTARYNDGLIAWQESHFDPAKMQRLEESVMNELKTREAFSDPTWSMGPDLVIEPKEVTEEDKWKAKEAELLAIRAEAVELLDSKDVKKITVAASVMTSVDTALKAIPLINSPFSAPELREKSFLGANDTILALKARLDLLK